jgi:RNA polymerase sigma-70 factor (ECF subfamily)
MNNEIDGKKIYEEFDSEILPHLSALKGYASKLTNDPDNADDLLQDTLLKAFRFFDKYEKGTNAKAWVFEIMKNSFIKNYWRVRREPDKVCYDDIQNFYETIKSHEVRTQHYENDAFSSVLSDEIINALSVLPDELRTVIFLGDVEGYSYQEIADFTDCPVGTVRSRMNRTRKILYSLLQGYAQNNGYIKPKQLKEKEQGERAFLKIIPEYQPTVSFQQ